MRIEATRDEACSTSIFSVIVSDHEFIRLNGATKWPMIQKMFYSLLATSKLAAIVEMASILEKAQAEQQLKNLEAGLETGSTSEVVSIIMSKPIKPNPVMVAIGSRENECGMRIKSNYTPICMASGNLFEGRDRSACNGRLDCPAFIPALEGGNQ